MSKVVAVFEVNDIFEDFPLSDMKAELRTIPNCTITMIDKTTDIKPMPDNFGLEGKWEIDESIQNVHGEDSYVCSFCQTIWESSNIKNMHYCPTCGALMKY